MTEADRLPDPAAQHLALSGATPEFRVLVHAVGLALRPSVQVVGLPGVEAVDEARLLDLAVRNHCLMLLIAGLERWRAAGAPGAHLFRPENQGAMLRIAKAATTRALFLSGQLVRLMQNLEERDVRAVALKGPAMAQVLYGDPVCRASDDLDIWVHPADFIRAGAHLESEGFKPLVALSPAEARAHMAAGWDRGYRSQAGDFFVELCTGIAPRHFGRAPNPDDLWRDAVRTALLGGIVRTPAPGHLPHLLGAHATKHLWSRLIWVADAARLAEAIPGMDWDRVARLSREQGSLRMTEVGLYLAKRLFGVPLPEAWSAAAGSSRQVAKLAGQSVAYLSGEEAVPGGWAETRFHLAARERARDRVRYLLLLLLTPSFGDWRWIGLPRGFRWLYWVLRPARLLAGKTMAGRRQK